jgi:protein-disulfide isomerase
MFCIVSAIILSILGIFSASNRQLAREALDCVFHRITFRPCTTGFDEKMKAKILGVVINRSERFARFLNKYFEALAWIFFVLLLSASIMFVRGLVLFYTTGSCNGVNSTAFCVFDPTGENNQTSSAVAGGACPVPTNTANGSALTLENVDLSLWPEKNAGAKNQLVFVGCYACDYTRKAYPAVKALVEKYGPDFYFGEYPTKLKTDYLSRIGNCVYKEDKEKYWQLNDVLFSEDVSKLEDTAATDNILSDLGLNAANIEACAADPKTEELVQKLFTEIKKTNFYGTPTIFINGEPLVGPKPYRVYAIQLEGFFFWLK